MRKGSRESIYPLSREVSRLEIPVLPRSTKPFSIFPEGIRRTNRPERSVVLPTASAAERASIAAAGNLCPVGPSVKFGSSRLLLRAEAGCREVQSGGRPNPLRCGPQAVSPAPFRCSD